MGDFKNTLIFVLLYFPDCTLKWVLLLYNHSPTSCQPHMVLISSYGPLGNPCVFAHNEVLVLNKCDKKLLSLHLS